MVYTDLLKKEVSCEKCHRCVEGHGCLLDQDVWVVLVSGDVGYLLEYKIQDSLILVFGTFWL